MKILLVATTTRAAALSLGLCLASHMCTGQGLSPRAYVITPVHTNVVTLTDSFQDGNVVFDQTLPITDSNGRISTATLTYVHSLSIFRRSTNINVSLPYSLGNFRANVLGMRENLRRSGLAPVVLRISINLKGGPAMTAEDFSKWRQKTVIGVSVTATAPAGQYDAARLINMGSNRWGLKPEVGFSQRWGRWLLDAYASAWFFTANRDFFSSAPGSSGPNIQTQQAMGVTETHLSYDVKPRLWVSFDGNYWYGGRTSVNGVPTPTTLQANSRLGATAAIPISRHQSIKISYSGGTYVRFGGNYQNVSVAWQYSWLGRPN